MPLWQETPLIYSNTLSTKLGADVYLKLEVGHLGSSSDVVLKPEN